jgi:hypothetical protein
MMDRYYIIFLLFLLLNLIFYIQFIKFMKYIDIKKVKNKDKTILIKIETFFFASYLCLFPKN